MPGTLYVVATPIGNLEDVTLRALRVLREVSLIAAEDTRRAARLLQHYSISTRTTSLHEHNERSRTPGLIARLAAGDSIAIVSDAGTPVMSDPGAHLVAAAHAAGIRVEPVPGPNAAIAALSASGFEDREFLFVGFPPARSNARKKWLQRLSSEERPIILYESPHRIRETLQDMAHIFGNRPIAIARELTKVHEELAIRPILDHLERIDEGRGEYTLVVAAKGPPAPDVSKPSEAAVAAEFGELTENAGLQRRAALKTIATRHRLPVREVFNLLEASRRSVE
jgi:16S rRNA (cytidine1402-2'-O)-methyltransferase